MSFWRKELPGNANRENVVENSRVEFYSENESQNQTASTSSLDLFHPQIIFIDRTEHTIDMGRQPRFKKSEQFGKGKVTPVQIAYIVDQYLSENHFTKTRTSFRSEASSLISKTPLHEGPKGLISLSTIIDEYVSMKEEKLVIEMEKKMMENERFRVESLLQGMQNVMNAYNASSSPPAAVSASSQQSYPIHTSPDGKIVNAPLTLAAAMVAPNARTSLSTQMGVHSSTKKRQASTIQTHAPTNVKKSCNKISNNQQNDGKKSTQHLATLQQSSTSGRVDNLAQVQSSSNVAKLMIHQTTSTATTMLNSSSTVTSPQLLSTQSDQNACSPVGHSSSTNSSNCTIVSTKTVIVSPYKQATYYSLQKHCSSTSSPVKTDHLQRSIRTDRVKGRLDFDNADETTSLEKSTVIESSISESDGNFFDLDLPVLDFDISDLLTDFGIYHEDLETSPGKCRSSVQENGSL